MQWTHKWLLQGDVGGSLITGLIRCRTSTSPGDVALNSQKYLKLLRQQMTGPVLQPLWHQEMGIIYTGASLSVPIKSLGVHWVNSTALGNACQSVIRAAPSPVPHSAWQPRTFAIRDLLMYPSKGTRFMLLVPSHFYSQDSTSLKDSFQCFHQ